MPMNISYINMCKLKKNRERRNELERERERGGGGVEVGGDGVCGCSFGVPLKPLYIFKHVLYLLGTNYNYQCVT